MKTRELSLKYVELLQKTYKKYEHVAVIDSCAKKDEIKESISKSDCVPKSSVSLVNKYKANVKEGISAEHLDSNNVDPSFGRKPPKISQHKNCPPFTLDQDNFLIEAIYSGKEIKPGLLAKQWGRPESSVRNRMNKLQRTGTSKKIRKHFTLEEDLMIMDVAIQCFKECKSLRDTNINSDERAQVALSLKRTKSHIYERWDKHLTNLKM